MESPAQGQLMARLLQTFAGEADERLLAMNRELLMLEASDDAATELQVEALFREAHSLKGAARAVNAERVERLAHRLESMFEQMREGRLAPEPIVCDVVYKALDALGQLVREVTADQPAEVDLVGLEAMLEHPEQGAGEPTSPRAAAATTPESPLETPPETTPETPPAPTHAPSAPPRSPAPSSSTVRLQTAKLDALLAEVGELAVAQAGAVHRISALRTVVEELQAWETATRRRRTARRRASSAESTDTGVMSTEDWERLRSTRKRVDELHRLLQEAGRRVTQTTTKLEAEVRRSRMLAVSAVLDAFPRMVRDIAREEDKQVTFVVNGAETEVDRALIEELRSPLTHIVRNSIDHGIEQPAIRVAAGKDPRGTISVSAYQQGGTLSVEVVDDGAGIDLTRVRAKAVERGLCSKEAADRMSDREATGLIYRSGFSTAPMITDLSGRGVGLDVVRDHVERLHGMIDVDSRAGSGTRFTFILPLSVSTTPSLLIGVAGQSFALPVTNVSRIVTVRREQIGHLEGTAVVSDEGSVVALADLASVLGIDRDAEHPIADPSPAILLGSADRRMAFMVDELVDLQNIVTKSLPPPLYRVEHLSGATILGTGNVITILNAANLIRTASPQREDEPRQEQTPAAATVVLLVEDSITTRALEKNILESAGYEVRTAGNGAEAWSKLEQGGIDAVVSDVYMSTMDGFELTAKLRADERFRRLPVVLVTSKDSRAHRDRGVEVGADAYIVKGSFEQQNLVDAIARLV